MSVITRFAPSPTGMIHIGSIRTAIFNYLFAKHHGGKYLLRVEDTDKERSTTEAIAVIHEALGWLGLEGDEPAVLQSDNLDRHVEVANDLLERGKAYKCFLTKEELEDIREKHFNDRPVFLDHMRKWRDANPSTHPDLPYVVRIKAPLDGETVIDDLVQGTVTVQNTQADDFVLLRSDGSPTYMLSVVVDDHDMGVTHIARGDDHLNNAFRQKHLFDAMGWDTPIFAHMPLIHGEDGKKLSKRHGAVSTLEFRNKGILPEAFFSYMLRLGWSYGDEEIIPRARAIELFSFDRMTKSPARFDLEKLYSFNQHFIRELSDDELLTEIEKDTGDLKDDQKEILIKARDILTDRAQTTHDLSHWAKFFITDTSNDVAEEDKDKISGDNATILSDIKDLLASLDDFSSDSVQQAIKDFTTSKELKMKHVGPPLRIALTGTMQSPPLFDFIAILGKDEIVKRLEKV